MIYGRLLRLLRRHRADRIQPMDPREQDLLDRLRAAREERATRDENAIRGGQPGASS